MIVPRASLAHIPDITSFTSWWWGESGHVYLSDVDDDDEENPHFEITVRGYREPEISGKTVVWGIPATNDRVASRVEVQGPFLFFIRGFNFHADFSTRIMISESKPL